MPRFDVCVVGGCGRVGLPLSIAFADRGLNVVVLDTDKDRVDKVSRGIMPFSEEGCEEALKRVIGKTLTVAGGPRSISESRFIVVAIGTSVENHSNPNLSGVMDLFNGLLPYLVPDQYIVLRSTVCPGMTEKVDRLLKRSGARIHISFCPERIAEGKALRELTTLPQIVSAFDEDGVRAVSDLFRLLTGDIVVLQPMEAELAKLFANAWRYTQFAMVNQFLMLATDSGVDYFRIHHALTYRYPRNLDLPLPGFAGGPCLPKDTMQLVEFSDNDFLLGHAAMVVNEGMPAYVVRRMKAEIDLAGRSVGILGMTFKANSDDERGSLSYKLKALLQVEAKSVLCSDPYVRREGFVDAEYLLRACDVIVLATPHDEYRSLRIPDNKILVDVWNLYHKGLLHPLMTRAHGCGDHGDISGTTTAVVDGISNIVGCPVGDEVKGTHSH